MFCLKSRSVGLCVFGLLGSLTIASAAESANTSQASSNSFFAKEKWGVDYLNYMNGPTFSESNGGSINHYLSLKHKINSDWAASFVLRPDSNFDNGSSFLTMDDPYFKLDYPVIYKNDSGVKVKGDVRYYAPVGESSKEAKLAGIISTRIYASANAGRLDLLYILIPKLYLNTQTVDGQKVLSHGHYFSGSYKMSPFWKLDFALYPAWTSKRNQAVAFNDLPAYPGFTMNFSETFSISPYVEIPLLNNKANNTSVGGLLSYTIL